MNSIFLRDIPTDLKKFILNTQSEKKIEKGVGQYSLCQTIYTLLREHPEFTKKKD